jgi:hypothetical protein
MNEPLVTALFVLVMAALIGWLYWAERRWPAPRRPMRSKETPATCARCTWRSGEDCTNPKSPVYPGPIGDVCSGRRRCKVREATQ